MTDVYGRRKWYWDRNTSTLAARGLWLLADLFSVANVRGQCVPNCSVPESRKLAALKWSWFLENISDILFALKIIC